MAKILITGNYSQITEEEDSGFLKELDKHLSWKVPGAEHTQAFKGFYSKKTGKFEKWDGLRHVMSGSLMFPTGLVPRIQKFYSDAQKEIIVSDRRKPKAAFTSLDISEKLIELEKIPFDYQLSALEACKVNDRGILKLATGAGKSILAALVTAHFNQKTIIYVIGKDLLYQFYNLFNSIFGKRVGIVGDGHCEIADFNIVSIWTAGQAFGMKKNEVLLDADDFEEKLNLNKKSDIVTMLKDTKLHVIDECHMSASATIQAIYKHSSADYIYGLSGTPWRDDNADLLVEGMLGEYIVDVSASYLIKRDFLAKPIIKFVNVPPLGGEESSSYQKLYKEYVTDNPVRNALIVKSTKALVNAGYQTLVLFNNIAHGKTLFELINKELNCAMLDGSDDSKTRERIKDDLANKRLDCVIASKIFDIGVDCPSLSGLVLAGGGKSSVKCLQRIGRVIRKYPGKKQAAVVDFVDNCKFLEKHSKIRYKIYKSENGFDVSWPKKS
jgi:superfamily II DNA or RNA helicase